MGCCFCCQSCVILTYLQFLLSKRHSSVNLHILYTWHTLSLCPEGTGHLGRHAMDIIPVLMGFQVYGGEVAASRAYSRVVPGSAGSMLSQGTLLQDAGCRARVGGRASCTLCFGDEVAVGEGCTGWKRSGLVLLQTRHTHLRASLILEGSHKPPLQRTRHDALSPAIWKRLWRKLVMPDEKGCAQCFIITLFSGTARLRPDSPVGRQSIWCFLFTSSVTLHCPQFRLLLGKSTKS